MLEGGRDCTFLDWISDYEKVKKSMQTSWFSKKNSKVSVSKVRLYVLVASVLSVFSMYNHWQCLIHQFSSTTFRKWFNFVEIADLYN